MLLDRDLRLAPLRRNEIMLYAVINPTNGLTDTPVSPTAVTVTLKSEDLVTDFGAVAAPFSQQVSDALTLKYGQPILAWVAQLPAAAYAGAQRLVVVTTVTVAGVAYPSTEMVSVVGP